MKSDIIILFWIIFFRLSKGEECPSNSDNSYCCEGFYRNGRSGKCDECPIGYFGKHCNSECIGGHYGEKCHLMCNCIDRQICNHVYGCVDMTTTDYLTTTQSLSTEYQTIMAITKTATLPVNYTSDQNLQFTDAWTEESGKHGTLWSSALLYGIPSALSFILVATVVVLIRWKMTGTCRIKRKIDHQENVSETVNSNDGYEMIDESLLGVQPTSGTQHQFSRNSERPRNDDDSARDSHNYFQPMAENDPPLPYKYDYVDDVVPAPISTNDDRLTESDDSEDLRNSIDYLDPISTMDSSSTSGSDVSNANVVPILSIDDYLHPYNTPDPDWRYKTHVYSEYKEQTDGHVNHKQTTLEQGIQTIQNAGQSSTAGKMEHVFETLDKPINRDEVVNLNESETKDYDNKTAEHQDTSETVCNVHDSKLPDKE